jgi:histidinol-phosphate aminotransferase
MQQQRVSSGRAAGTRLGPEPQAWRQQRPSRMNSVAATATATAEPEAKAPGAGANFLRKHLLKLAAYTPIEPFEVLSSRYGLDPKDIIKLDANENPYGPPPEVREALATMPFPHIYPDPETRNLRKELAKVHGISADYLLVSRKYARG